MTVDGAGLMQNGGGWNCTNAINVTTEDVSPLWKSGTCTRPSKSDDNYDKADANGGRSVSSFKSGGGFCDDKSWGGTVFSDDFAGAELNSSLWNVEVAARQV